MRQVILKEVQNVIPEAKYEPSATQFETNNQQSIIQQEKINMLNLGSTQLPQHSVNDVCKTFVENNRVDTQTKSKTMCSVDKNNGCKAKEESDDGLPFVEVFYDEGGNQIGNIDHSSTSETVSKCKVVKIIDRYNQVVIEYNLDDFGPLHRSVIVISHSDPLI